jgi:hypothetical protein
MTFTGWKTTPSTIHGGTLAVLQWRILVGLPVAGSQKETRATAEVHRLASRKERLDPKIRWQRLSLKKHSGLLGQLLKWLGASLQITAAGTNTGCALRIRN